MKSLFAGAARLAASQLHLTYTTRLGSYSERIGPPEQSPLAT
jgi:hypothetical protein